MGVGGVGWTAHQFSLGSIHVFGVYVYWRIRSFLVCSFDSLRLVDGGLTPLKNKL